MIRRMLTVIGVIGVLCCLPAWAQGQGQGQGGDWPINVDRTTDMVGALFCNPCADPPEVLEIVDGSSHEMIAARPQYNEAGTFVGMDWRIHMNHQGLKAIGHDLMTNEQGQMIDANGNVVQRCRDAARVPDAPTTEYSIPGHYQYTQNVSGENNKGEATEVFMCHMISHGSEENALVHYNGHINVDFSTGTLEYTLDKDNLWCKCAGPDQDGDADCQNWPDNCINLILY